MAVSFQYDAAQQLLLVTFEGDLRDPELVQAHRTTRECASEYPVQRGIIDGLKVRLFEGSAETVRSLAHQPSMFPQDVDHCIVVQQDSLYGMARMYQLLGGESRERLRVVRTLQEAYDYLKIQAPANLKDIAK